MKIDVATIAGAPPRGSVLTRATGRRLAGDVAGANRTIDFVASTPEVARDGHRILSDAWDLGNFLANPVFLAFHMDDEPPIGRVTKLRTVGVELRALVRFAEPEVYPFADVVFQLYKGNYLNAVSVGFLPLDWKAANDRARPGGVDFTRVELLELSAVSIPSLPTALATARAAGIDVRPMREWAERALDTGNTQHREEDFVMIRNAAGAPKSYAAPRAPAGRQVAADRLAFRHARPTADPATGWRSLGEFLQAVARAATDTAKADRRLTRGPTGLNIDDVSAGGFLVPTHYLDGLVASLYEEAVIAPHCIQLESDHPAECRLPGIDETSRADGSRWGGAVSYWDAEGASVSASLPKFRSVDFSASKLFAVCATTSELLADAPMLESYIRLAFSAEFSFKVDTAIFAGTGAGQPLGILNSPACISVAKQNGQAAASIVADNIEDMWSRLAAPCRRRAVWLVAEDVEKQISLGMVAVGTGGSISATAAGLYIPAGVAGNEFPLLKGRPVVAVEQAPAIGTPGDIVLCDLSQYAIVGSPLRVDLSLDVKFLTDEGMFRFAWRVDGQPLWKSPIKDYNTSATRSPFVALAAR